MSLDAIPFEDVIKLQKNNSIPHIYDIEMNHIDKLKRFDSIECHIVLFPHSRNITSRNIIFYPFEEYVQDISSNQRSAYSVILKSGSNIFGMLLGLLIAAIVFVIHPAALVSIEALVSIFGAYFIGKNLWLDIEGMLLNRTKHLRVRYHEKYYRYQLERYSTLTRYSLLAKQCRYGQASLLPEKMDFIRKSNSQTIRMYFPAKDLKSFHHSSAHILSVHIDPSLIKDLKEKDFLLGVKLSFNIHRFGTISRVEIFQSLNKGVLGCLDAHDKWVTNGIFYRNTITFGNLKYYKDMGLIQDKSVIKYDLS